MHTSLEPIFLYLKSNDVSVKGIICPDKRRTCYAGIPVITVDEINKQIAQRMFVIIIDPDCFYDDRPVPQSWGIRFIKWAYQLTRVNTMKFKYKRSSIIKILKKSGILNYYFLGKIEFKEISLIDSPDNYNRINYYKNHLNELKKTYDLLYDNISKETMLEFMRAYLQGGLYRDKECDGRNKYFAGYGRGEAKELLYIHKEDEVWVNCGAFVGDTILLYLSEGYRARKIYAFEGSKVVYKTLCKNIKQLPEELKRTIIPINKFISEGTRWSSDVEEKITLINADIEGYELELLHSMRDRIKSDRPVLAICVYHRSEDLVEIPQSIGEIVEGYKYLLRKYPSSIINAMRTSELVLYAIPQERLLIG